LKIPEGARKVFHEELRKLQDLEQAVSEANATRLSGLVDSGSFINFVAVSEIYEIYEYRYLGVHHPCHLLHPTPQNGTE